MSYGIFLVEDHPVMREAYVQFLEVEPDLSLCGVSETAEEFLALVDETPCDLVVTDLSLPGMDGIALVREIRARRPELPAIVISAHEEESFQKRAREAGARAYLAKRDLVSRLSATVREVMTAAGPPPDGPAPSAPLADA